MKNLLIGLVLAPSYCKFHTASNCSAGSVVALWWHCGTTDCCTLPRLQKSPSHFDTVFELGQNEELNGIYVLPFHQGVFDLVTCHLQV